MERSDDWPVFRVHLFILYIFIEKRLGFQFFCNQMKRYDMVLV